MNVSAKKCNTDEIEDEMQFLVHLDQLLPSLGVRRLSSEHIIGPGSHIEYPTRTKNINFVEDHPRNIPAKFGSNRPSGFGEEA
jgi:hypothetical protein